MLNIFIPYSNFAVMNNDTYNSMTQEVYDWLNEHFGLCDMDKDKYDLNKIENWKFAYNGKGIVFEFKDEHDAMLFKLSWCGL